MKNIICLILWLYCLNNVIAQSENIRWYNTNNGLPQNSVKYIVKDKYGFLWLATENGLCRFDGNTFINFNNFSNINKHLSEIRGHVANDCLVAFSSFNEDKFLIKNRKVIALKTIKKEKEQAKISVLNNSSTSNYNSIDVGIDIQLKNGIFFLKSDNHNFFSRNHESNKAFTTKDLNIRQIHLLVVDDFLFIPNFVEKKIYKLTPQGLIAIKAADILFDQKNTIFWHKTNNQCLIYHHESIYKVTFENNQLKTNFICDFPDFNAHNIKSIYFDETYNKLYLGSLTKGFGVLALKEFKVSKTKTDDLNNVYYAMIPFGYDQVVTPNGQILNANGLVKDFEFNHLNDYIFKTHILSHGNQSYWTKNYSFLLKYTYSKNNQLLLTEKVDLKKSITALFDLNDGAAVVLNNALTKPLHEDDLENWLQIYNGYDFKKLKHQFKTKQSIQAVLKTSYSTYLVGCNKGLYRLNTQKMTWQLINGSKNFNIKNIQQTANGHIWVCVYDKGLHLLKNNKLIMMPLDFEKSLKDPHCLLEDTSNHLWLSTNNGLFNVSESDLLAYAANTKKKINYYVYDKYDGLNSNEFNGRCFPCGVKLANGQFVLPSMDGVVFFKPDEVPHLYPHNGFYIERVKIDDETTYYFNEKISLQNNFFRATVYPDVPYYANHKNLFLEAFLEGKSRSWERVDLKKGYEITNLEHGKYELRFRLLTSSAGDYIYKSTSIEVAPLFYQTNWFKAIMVAGFLIAFFLFYKIRLRYFEKIKLKLNHEVNHKTKDLQLAILNLEKIKHKLNQEVVQQKKLIGSISHDVATPLKYIHLISAKMAELSDEDLALNRDLILSLKNSSGEITKFIDSLKDYATIYNESSNQPFETFDLFGVIEEKVNLFNEIINSKSIVVLNNVLKPSMIFTNKNILKIVLHNVIDNAVKYSPSGSIGFSFEQDQDFYTITITDTGVGMTDDIMQYYANLQKIKNDDKLKLQNFGMGLHMVVQLLTVINGQLFFKKNVSTGTTVILKISKETTKWD